MKKSNDLEVGKPLENPKPASSSTESDAQQPQFDPSDNPKLDPMVIDLDVRYVLTDQGRAALADIRREQLLVALCEDCHEPVADHIRKFLGSRRCWVELEWDS